MTQKIISLGLRFSNSDYTYAVMSGTKKAPTIIEIGTIGYPKGFQRAQTLKWLLHEQEAIHTKYKIGIVVIKKFEGRSKGNAFEDRVEGESTAFIAAASSGLKAVYKKMGSTIAKDLGLKGKASLLKTDLDTTVIENYDQLSDKEKDAILSSWSELI